MKDENPLRLYGHQASPEKVTLIERPVWRVFDADNNLVALCLSENDAAHITGALNEFKFRSDV